MIPRYSESPPLGRSASHPADRPVPVSGEPKATAIGRSLPSASPSVRSRRGTGSVGRVHPLIVALAAVWGLAGGLAVARAPWRRWFGEETQEGSGPAPRAASWWPPVIGAVVCAGLARVTGGHPETVVWLLLVPPALLLARVDLAVKRLPDAVTLPTAAGTAAALGGAALLPGHAGSWPRALLGAAALGAAYFVLLLVNPAGMGFGDVKLALTLGAALGWYGWPAVFTGTLLAFVLGALTAVALLAARRADRKTALPFGPFMLAGALGGLLLGAL